MTTLTSIPELALPTHGLVASLELDGDHWDLVLLPVGTTALQALKPTWRLRFNAFPSYPEDDFTGKALLYHMAEAMKGLTGGYLEQCDRR